MRWFTRDLPFGSIDMPDAEWDRRVEAYYNHIEGLRPHLPPGLRLLTHPERTKWTLHDAVFERIVVDQDQRTTTLVLATSPGPEVTIRYEDADILPHSLRYALGILIEAVRLDETTAGQLQMVPLIEILYDELDHGSRPGELEHRFLCWPVLEFSIRFRDADVTIHERQEEEAPVTPDRMFVLPADADILAKANQRT